MSRESSDFSQNAQLVHDVLPTLDLPGASRDAIERWLLGPRYAEHRAGLDALVRAAAGGDAAALAEL
ncbi:MAG: hypothetical protein KC468_06130, partial [Myxococcales bacterium]|nr:hypothetical protein [Myxococcales bacterium]